MTGIAANRSLREAVRLRTRVSTVKLRVCAAYGSDVRDRSATLAVAHLTSVEAAVRRL